MGPSRRLPELTQLDGLGCTMRSSLYEDTCSHDMIESVTCMLLGEGQVEEKTNNRRTCFAIVMNGKRIFG